MSSSDRIRPVEQKDFALIIHNPTRFNCRLPFADLPYTVLYCSCHCTVPVLRENEAPGFQASDDVANDANKGVVLRVIGTLKFASD
eukprot:2738706-Pyramimonas_sp.AAC.3